MTLLAVQIPDTTPQLAKWLELHLTGLHMGELVAELIAVHGDRVPTKSLDEILDHKTADVLANGLQSLSGAQLRTLLSHPRLLVQLQEEISRRGGAYWSELPCDAELREAIERQWEHIQAENFGPKSRTAARGSAAPLTRRVWVARAVFAGVGTVAALLLVTFLGPRFQQQGPAVAQWGWNNPAALKQSPTGKEYLGQLADYANQYFDSEPKTREELASRIGDFRRSCDVIQKGAHPSLAEGDRKWLKERCEKWAAKLDGHLADLKAGYKTEEVRGAAKSTVEKLIKAIRDQAEKTA